MLVVAAQPFRLQCRGAYREAVSEQHVRTSVAFVVVVHDHAVFGPACKHVTEASGNGPFVVVHGLSRASDPLVQLGVVVVDEHDFSRLRAPCGVIHGGAICHRGAIAVHGAVRIKSVVDGRRRAFRVRRVREVFGNHLQGAFAKLASRGGSIGKLPGRIPANELPAVDLESARQAAVAGGQLLAGVTLQGYALAPIAILEAVGVPVDVAHVRVEHHVGNGGLPCRVVAGVAEGMLAVLAVGHVVCVPHELLGKLRHQAVGRRREAFDCLAVADGCVLRRLGLRFAGVPAYEVVSSAFGRWHVALCHGLAGEAVKRAHAVLNGVVAFAGRAKHRALRLVGKRAALAFEREPGVNRQPASVVGGGRSGPAVLVGAHIFGVPAEQQIAGHGLAPVFLGLVVHHRAGFRPPAIELVAGAGVGRVACRRHVGALVVGRERGVHLAGYVGRGLGGVGRLVAGVGHHAFVLHGYGARRPARVVGVHHLLRVALAACYRRAGRAGMRVGVLVLGGKARVGPCVLGQVGHRAVGLCAVKHDLFVEGHLAVFAHGACVPAYERVADALGCRQRLVVGAFAQSLVGPAGPLRAEHRVVSVALVGHASGVGVEHYVYLLGRPAGEQRAGGRFGRVGRVFGPPKAVDQHGAFLRRGGNGHVGKHYVAVLVAHRVTVLVGGRGVPSGEHVSRHAIVVAVHGREGGMRAVGGRREQLVGHAFPRGGCLRALHLGDLRQVHVERDADGLGRPLGHVGQVAFQHFRGEGGDELLAAAGVCASRAVTAGTLARGGILQIPSVERIADAQRVLVGLVPTGCRHEFGEVVRRGALVLVLQHVGHALPVVHVELVRGLETVADPCGVLGYVRVELHHVAVHPLGVVGLVAAQVVGELARLYRVAALGRVEPAHEAVLHAQVVRAQAPHVVVGMRAYGRAGAFGAVHHGQQVGSHLAGHKRLVGAHVGVERYVHAALQRQVAGVGRAAVHVCVGGVHVLVVIGRVSATDQGLAVLEHVVGVGYAFGIPRCRNLYGGKLRASFEHAAHVCHLAGVEAGKVERRQLATALEHVAHVKDACGVQRLRNGGLALALDGRGDYLVGGGASAEHAGHVGHLGGVKHAHVEARHLCAVGEHLSHVGNVAGVERAHV